MASVSNYIVDNDPQRYGGQQLDYIKRRDEAIAHALTMLNETVEQKGDLQQLFFKINAYFAEVRHEIAVAHGTECAQRFGRKRVEHSTKCFYFEDLWAKNNFKEYHGKVVAFLNRILQKKVTVLGPLPKRQVLNEQAAGRACTFELEVLSQEQMDGVISRGKEDLDDRLMAAYQLPFPETVKVSAFSENNRFLATPEEQAFIKAYKKWHEDKKKSDPEFYNRIKLQNTYEILRLHFKVQESEKNLFGRQKTESLFLRGVVRIEVGGKMVALFEMLTWAFKKKDSPHLLEIDSTAVTILKTDQFLMPELLRECSKLFEQAVLWKKSDEVQALTDRTSLLRYLQAPMQEVERGSAAITEWMEILLYKFQKFPDFRHNPSKAGDLEALTSLWSTFHRNYPSTIAI